jgi:hypothetical protein
MFEDHSRKCDMHVPTDAFKHSTYPPEKGFFTNIHVAVFFGQQGELITTP